MNRNQIIFTIFRLLQQESENHFSVRKYKIFAQIYSPAVIEIDTCSQIFRQGMRNDILAKKKHPCNYVNLVGLQ